MKFNYFEHVKIYNKVNSFSLLIENLGQSHIPSTIRIVNSSEIVLKKGLILVILPNNGESLDCFHPTSLDVLQPAIYSYKRKEAQQDTRSAN